MRKITQDEYVSRCREHHGERYDYSETVYESAIKHLTVICREHGPWKAWATHHMHGGNCPKCAGPGVKGGDAESFFAKANIAHGDRYDYSNSKYQNNKTPVSIACRIHGEFLNYPSNHIKGQGCQLCAGMYGRGIDGFIIKAKEKHGDRYDYYFAEYKGPKVALRILCPKHGIFQQDPTHHLGGQGCPTCGGIGVTKPHSEICDYIDSLKFSYEVGVRSVIGPKELDVYIPFKNLAIEFNGTYWHSQSSADSRPLRNDHRDKFLACKTKGIRLLQIDEHEWRNETRRNIWKSIIASKLGIHETEHARKTEFCEIDSPTAKAFLNDNHLQGSGNGIRFCYALKLDGEIIAVMTFSYHQKDQINLTRMAFRRGLSIAGGSSKLFSNAIKLLPEGYSIVSFSDNRYSNGNVYSALGFRHDKVLPPSYQWVVNGQKVSNKRQWRHSELIKKLPNYRPEETESENMFRHKHRRLWDSGYSRWVFDRPAVPEKLEEAA